MPRIETKYEEMFGWKLSNNKDMATVTQLSQIGNRDTGFCNIEIFVGFEARQGLNNLQAL